MKGFVFIAMLISLFSSALRAQMIARLEVDLVHATAGLIMPAKIELNGVTKLGTERLSLMLVRNGKQMPVEYQVSTDNGTVYLHWLVEPLNDSEKKLTYHLVKGKSPASPLMMKAVNDNGSLTIQSGDRNLLRYQYTRLEAPAGVDPAYGRSGFIHPLWSPGGQVLTRIQPTDHYHHYGLWNPWTHVLYDGDTLDFWNLNKKEGTVRFAKLLNSVDGPVFSEYQALHEHVVLKNGNDKVALNETQGVRIYQPANRDYYIADITIDLATAGKTPFRILAYRYAGLGWRATEKWDNKNSEVLTSENKTRKDADGSTARWCIIQGAIDDAYAGAVMMSFPGNYEHPEPLRIWPENQYDRGDMFANFAPTKYKDWELLPGKTYPLRYRFIVFNGRFNQEKAEAAWQYFANPVKVTLKK